MHERPLHVSPQATGSCTAPDRHGTAPVTGLLSQLPSTRSQWEGVTAREGIAAAPITQTSLFPETTSGVSHVGRSQGDHQNVQELAVPVRVASRQGDAGGQDAGVATGAEPQASIPGWGLRRWSPEGWNSSQWGAGGVWLEPFDVESANETLHMLFAHYSSQASESPTIASASRLEFSGAKAGGGSCSA